MPLIIAVLLGLSALVVVCYPLLGLEAAPEVTDRLDPLAEVVDRETQAKRALREVEFDHRLGNLENADYESLRERYEQRALEALRERYDREQELDARIDRELATLRSSPPSGKGAKNRLIGSGESTRTEAARPHGGTLPKQSRPRRRRGV